MNQVEVGKPTYPTIEDLDAICSERQIEDYLESFF